MSLRMGGKGHPTQSQTPTPTYHPLTNTPTRPDTRPPVADGWAGADMRVFPLFDPIITDGWTGGPTDGSTNGRTKLLIELCVRN